MKAQRAAEDDRLRNDWAWLKKFGSANAQLSAPAAGEERVVFMGNSIFEAWARHFNTMFPGKPFINRESAVRQLRRCLSASARTSLRSSRKSL